MAVKKRLHFFYYLISVVVLLAFPFVAQPVQVYAQQDWRGLSADVDGDGLPNEVEDAGWRNAAGGPFITDYLDADSDDDGLTDGQEKLYDTDPLDDHSPGIFVEYQSDLKTRQYFPWQRFGSKYIVLPTSGLNSVVVRRGSTFSVGGPADATLQITESTSLTDLSAVRNPCSGRWEVHVPADGTVGIYTITVQDGGWSESLNLYVIFEILDGLGDGFVDNFLYDDDPNNNRDESAIGYYEGDDGSHVEYDHDDYDWIPVGEWITHGYTWRFRTEHFRNYVFEDHVMPAINGKTNTWDAANALGQRVDEVTCFGHPRPLGNSWCVLNPSSCYPDYNNKNQCTNIANLLTAFNRAAGIPARTVFTDWTHNTFDHSTEVWTRRPSGGSYDWFVMRGYDGGEGSCPDPHYTGGYNPLRNTYGWYWSGQGVYTAAENWNAGDFGGGSAWKDMFRMASWDLDKSAQTAKMVKKGWFETRFGDYWGWPSEPQITGSPPHDWPSLPPPPVAEFSGAPTTGPAPLTVAFTDQSTGHIRTWSWDFGDDVTSPDQNPSHIYENAGVYTVTLTVQGAGGSDTMTKTAYIQVEGGGSGLLGSSADQRGLGVLSTPSGLSAIEFGQVVADYGVDLNGDGRYDQLVFDVQVNVLQEGDYWMRGVLGGNGGTPVGADSMAEAIGYVHLTPGPHTVQLPFDGMPIYMSKVDGPYTLKGLWLTDVPNPTKSDFAERELAYVAPNYQTAAYGYADFGLAGARLTGAYNSYVVDTDGDGLADALVVETDLDIARAGTYTAQAALYSGQEEMVSQATWSGSGPHVRLQFEGLRDTVGPYSLQHLHVRNAAGEVTDGISEPYALGDLPELSATPVTLGVAGVVPAEIGATFVITNGYSDTRVDDDGDGLYDRLVINASVEVEAGEGNKWYRLEGWLVDPNNDLVAWATGESQVLDEGVHALSLAFDGRIIRQHGVDGPYTLVALKAVRGTGYAVMDSVDVAYTTAAYSYESFEEPRVLPIATILDDTMEDGSDNWTAGASWDLNGHEWFSYDHAWEADISGAQSDALTTITLDGSGYAEPALQFRTCYAMQSAEDEGYVEVSTNGVDWTRMATYGGSTAHWATQFVDLTGFGDQPALQVRFNANSRSGLLWYVDDVYIGGWMDEDGDGILTIDEDLNGDGDPSNDDSDGDGVPDYLEPNDVDTDGDGIYNNLDPDDDGDGIPTAVEIVNGDSDGDGTPNYLDPDDDNDGVLTADEDFNGDGDPANDDSDGDGTPNYLDADDDEDGIPTSVEGPTADADGDHVPDYLEPYNGDTDNDGTFDYLDPDDDGDGVPTAEEDWDHDGNPTNDDGDEDSIPDYLDPDISEAPTQYIFLPLVIK
ncbi:MAG: hypothetical protein Kow0063_17010 [Anaerolineae bacterium]